MARFVERYGIGQLWSQQWPTQDHGIPWRLFLLLLSQIPRLEAREVLRMTEATMYAIGATFVGGDESRSALEDLMRRAGYDG